MPSVMGALVRIRPTTSDHLLSISKYGGLYWMRETYAGKCRLIPVKDGIPYVADFIFVPVGDVLIGSDRSQGIKGAGYDLHEGAQHRGS
jgi:hypothetical protein